MNRGAVEKFNSFMGEGSIIFAGSHNDGKTPAYPIASALVNSIAGHRAGGAENSVKQALAPTNV